MPHDKLEGSKTLGLIWGSNRDIFKYSPNQNHNDSYTKRSVLSSIARIFDPLGFLGPRTLQIDLFLLNEVSIPRHVATFSEHTQLDLHGFCDAIERACGACIYVRTINRYGNIAVSLLCSKRRAAPLKTISLPRLELCGAQLLSHLTHKVIHSLQCYVDSCYLWTDSTIVLNWLASPPNSWNTSQIEWQIFKCTQRDTLVTIFGDTLELRTTQPMQYQEDCVQNN
ncbi:hypothetical protein NQ318_019113 [Aromia moschata]|uniref:RNase H type-1 domain-containing protein n=1 Tax=Aromia moschata TaxID=1265417 RepID=A0AAV8XR64_9CUCU|nr:hypothetical protein NQ318_019113 [Aromia moschata]